MNEMTPGLSAVAEGFERLSVEDGERVLDAISEAQRALAHMPGSEETFGERILADPRFLCGLADRIGEARFEALLVEADLGDDVREGFGAKAAANGGIVSLVKSPLEPSLRISSSGVCCATGGVLAVGGAWLAIDGVVTADPPLALFGGVLFGLGGAAMYSCC